MSDEGHFEDRERRVRHASDAGALPLGETFSCAASGIRYAFATQRNLKIHSAFAVVAIVLGFALEIPASSWLAVILCIATVFALETVNTAIESVVDMASPQWHELAMRAKDCAAGAVLLAALGSLAVAAVVYIPPLMSLMGKAIG